MQCNESNILNPDQFMEQLKHNDSNEYDLSLKKAKELDQVDPLAYVAELFEVNERLLPFAGHSLGPVFKPLRKAFDATFDLQKQQLHGGHFPLQASYVREKLVHQSKLEAMVDETIDELLGNWFDCDRNITALAGVKQLLHFKKDEEFNFTANGLSENLKTLIDTFYHVDHEEWKNGQTKIAMLATEFFSDQAIVSSVIAHKLKDRNKVDEHILRIQPINDNGIYSTESIIAQIRAEAKSIQMICLSDIVFNTGQRLELKKIFDGMKDLIETKGIRVILDLAHTVGNRDLDLSQLPVIAAVGCAYKHLSCPPGSGFGIYVRYDADLEKHKVIQGWKAAHSDQVFAKINTYDQSIMKNKGAVAFRTSNPPPLAVLPVETYAAIMGKIGFEKLFNRSECLTRYLIALLQFHLKDTIEIITPLDPKQRGATIAIRLKKNIDVIWIEQELKNAGFEVDTRPPNIIRITAHYGYTSFEQVNRLVNQLKHVLEHHIQE